MEPADCAAHDPGPGHPDAVARLGAIRDRLIAGRLLDLLAQPEVRAADRAHLQRVHTPAYLDALAARLPREGRLALDPDTLLSPGTLVAAAAATGAVVGAVDRVLEGTLDRAFCSVRPPGHHAEAGRAMGFCFYNNVAVGAAHAVAVHGLQRVAIFDFDAHYGNGTESIFRDEPRVGVFSTYEDGLYPEIPEAARPRRFHRAALAPGADGAEFKHAVRTRLMPALERFRPQLLLVSAGFDGHRQDELSRLRLREADYQWITLELADIADRHAGGRLVSVLEGGYALLPLARSVASHVDALLSA